MLKGVGGRMEVELKTINVRHNTEHNKTHLIYALKIFNFCCYETRIIKFYRHCCVQLCNFCCWILYLHIAAIVNFYCIFLSSSTSPRVVVDRTSGFHYIAEIVWKALIFSHLFFTLFMFTIECEAFHVPSYDVIFKFWIEIEWSLSGCHRLFDVTMAKHTMWYSMRYVCVLNNIREAMNFILNSLAFQSARQGCRSYTWEVYELLENGENSNRFRRHGEL